MIQRIIAQMRALRSLAISLQSSEATNLLITVLVIKLLNHPNQKVLRSRSVYVKHFIRKIMRIIWISFEFAY